METTVRLIISGVVSLVAEAFVASVTGDANLAVAVATIIFCVR